jgi:hypothetical protein
MTNIFAKELRDRKITVLPWLPGVCRDGTLPKREDRTSISSTWPSFTDFGASHLHLAVLPKVILNLLR